MSKFLITGAAGFIGFHLCKKLVESGYQVVGLDNINSYYDVNLKLSRLEQLGINKNEIVENKIIESNKYSSNFRFIKLNIEDRENLPLLFSSEKFDTVVNLAAQAGVRYSIENPESYIDSNIVGFLNILESCRHYKVEKLLYASSSSVYGNSTNVPFKTQDDVSHPISLYAATKKSNELMAFTYSHLYGLKTIGLRFFTVYGPWGRPDMAMFLFTDAILNNRAIKVFNNGDLSRDFTFIDDIIQGIDLLLKDNKNSNLYELFNIGNSKPVQLMEFVEAIEKVTNKKAIKEMLPMQPGDVLQTWADVEDLKSQYGYNPNFSVLEGVTSFIEWYKDYYNYI